MRTAKAFTNEAVEREKFLACNDRYKHSKTDWYRAMGVFQGGMEFTMSAMQVVVIALGGAYIMRGQIDYIDLITFSLYVTTFISPSARWSTSWRCSPTARPASSAFWS